MQPILDMGTFAPALDKSSNYLDVVNLARLKTSTVMKNELFVLIRSDLAIDVSLSRF